VIHEITGATVGGRMSTLSLDPAVSLFEPATRPAAVATTAARVQSAGSAPRDERHGRHSRHSTRPQATHARRTSAGTAPGLAVLARTAHLVAVRALGTSAAAAAVTWALTARSTGDAAALATSSLRGLAAAAVIWAAWGFQDRARLGALDATRIWYGTASLLAVAHTVWFATATPGRLQDNLGLVTAVFTLDVVLVVVPALLGARAGRPEGATA
jgi:hypothetical protein